MISKVIRFQDDTVRVFDEKEKHIPEFEGKYQDVRVKILARAPRSTKFYHVSTIRAEVLRKDW